MSFKWEAIDRGTRVACLWYGPISWAAIWSSGYEPDAQRLAPVCNTIEDWLRRE